MSMKIQLEQLATEALGIPDGMMEATDFVWNKMMDIWAADMERQGYVDKELGNGDEQTVIVPGPIKIKGEEWDAVEIEWDVKTVTKETPKIDTAYAGAGFKFISNLAQNFKRIEGADKNIIPLQMVILTNMFNTWEDVYDAVNGPLEKTIYITLSHELKHAFDHRIEIKSTSSKKGIKVQSRERYNIASQQTGIYSINQFNYKVYYTHFLENLVRPVEFLAGLKQDKVTKKEFGRALMNSDMYKRLQDIRDYTYKNLIDSIKQDSQAIIFIIQHLSDKGADVDEYSEEELVNEVLKFNFYQTIETMRESYIERAVGNSFYEFSKFMSGTLGDVNKDKNDAMEKVLAEISRFGDNYEAFYKYEIKQMNILAGKTIRKLAKVYDYLPA